MEIIGHHPSLPEYWTDDFAGSPNGFFGDTYLSLNAVVAGHEIYLTEISASDPITDYDFKDNPNIKLIPLDPKKTKRWPRPNFVNNKDYLMDPRSKYSSGFDGSNYSVRPEEDSSCNYYWGNVILIVNGPIQHNHLHAYSISRRSNTLIKRNFISILTQFAEVIKFYFDGNPACTMDSAVNAKRITQDILRRKEEQQQELVDRLSGSYQIKKSVRLKKLFLDSEPQKRTEQRRILNQRGRRRRICSQPFVQPRSD